MDEYNSYKISYFKFYCAVCICLMMLVAYCIYCKRDREHPGIIHTTPVVITSAQRYGRLPQSPSPPPLNVSQPVNQPRIDENQQQNHSIDPPSYEQAVSEEYIHLAPHNSHSDEGPTSGRCIVVLP